MIEILTLMLGIMVGSTTVELRVDSEVERVEVRVDGEIVQQLDGPPWRFDIEWGDEILPRVLEAIAFGADGAELGRDRRWINLRTSDSMARLVFPPPDEDGRVSHFAVRWASIGTERPRAVTAVFGDQILPVTSADKIVLPAYDPEKLHWLSVEVDFGAAGKETLGASLGGETLVELAAELTAVAVEVESRSAASQLGGRILVQGRPAAIHGVEKGPADLVMVADRSAVDQLLKLSHTLGGQNLPRERIARRSANSPGKVPRGNLSFGLPVRELARFGRLGDETYISFLWPRAASWQGPMLKPEMFTESAARPLGEVGLLAATYRQQAPRPKSSIASAVAIAGLTAASSSRRRAVVLVAENLADAELERVASVVRYLEVLRVPLYVWTLGADAAPGPWPKARHLGDLENAQRTRRALDRALSDLRSELDSQRIVWIEGRYLPQNISLAPDARGLRWPG